MDIVDKRRSPGALIAAAQPQPSNGTPVVQTSSLPKNPNPQPPGAIPAVPRGARPPMTTGALPARQLAIAPVQPSLQEQADADQAAQPEPDWVGDPAEREADLADLRAQAIGVMQPWTLEEAPEVVAGDAQSLRRAIFWALSRETPDVVAEWFAGEAELEGATTKYVLAGGPHAHWPEGSAQVQPAAPKPGPAAAALAAVVTSGESGTGDQGAQIARAAGTAALLATPITTGRFEAGAANVANGPKPRMNETKVEKPAKDAPGARRMGAQAKLQIKQLILKGHTDEEIAEAVAFPLDKVAGYRTGNQMPSAEQIRTEFAEGKTREVEAAPAITLAEANTVPGDAAMRASQAAAHIGEVAGRTAATHLPGAVDLDALLRLTKRRLHESGESPNNAREAQALVEELRAEVAAWDVLTGRSVRGVSAEQQSLKNKKFETQQALLEATERELSAFRAFIGELLHAFYGVTDAAPASLLTDVRELRATVASAEAALAAADKVNSEVIANAKGAPPSKMQVAVDMVKKLDTLEAMLNDQALDEDGVIAAFTAQIAEMRKYLYTCP